MGCPRVSVGPISSERYRSCCRACVTSASSLGVVCLRKGASPPGCYSWALGLLGFPSSDTVSRFSSLCVLVWDEERSASSPHGGPGGWSTLRTSQTCSDMIRGTLPTVVTVISQYNFNFVTCFLAVLRTDPLPRSSQSMKTNDRWMKSMPVE